MHHTVKKDSKKGIKKKEKKNKVTKNFFRGIRTQTLRISYNQKLTPQPVGPPRSTPKIEV